MALREKKRCHWVIQKPDWFITHFRVNQSTEKISNGIQDFSKEYITRENVYLQETQCTNGMIRMLCDQGVGIHVSWPKVTTQVLNASMDSK